MLQLLLVPIALTGTHLGMARLSYTVEQCGCLHNEMTYSKY